MSIFFYLSQLLLLSNFKLKGKLKDIIQFPCKISNDIIVSSIQLSDIAPITPITLITPVNCP